jgi:hypothetical protein
MVEFLPRHTTGGFERMAYEMCVSSEGGHGVTWALPNELFHQDRVIDDRIFPEAVADVVAEDIEDDSSVEDFGSQEQLVGLVDLLGKMVDFVYELLPDLGARKPQKTVDLVPSITQCLKAMRNAKEELNGLVISRTRR